MIKCVAYTLFGLLVTSISLASPNITPTPFNWLPAVAQANQDLKAQEPNLLQSSAAEENTEDYADFSGSWTGECSLEGSNEILDGLDINLDITADSKNIEFFYEGNVFSYKIGRDNSTNKQNNNGFLSTHYVFQWLNKSTLTFNLAYLNTLMQGKVESAIMRITMNRTGDTLEINSEYDNLTNTQKLKHIKGLCKFVKRV